MPYTSHWIKPAWQRSLPHVVNFSKWVIIIYLHIAFPTRLRASGGKNVFHIYICIWNVQHSVQHITETLTVLNELQFMDCLFAAFCLLMGAKKLDWSPFHFHPCMQAAVLSRLAQPRPSPGVSPGSEHCVFLGDGYDLCALVPFAHLAHVPQKSISLHLNSKLELKHWLFLGLKPIGLQVGTITSVLLVLRPSDTD